MYFVRYQPLKTQLRERLLTDRETLPYLIADTVLAYHSGDPDIVPAILRSLVAVWGIVYVYKQNGGNSGFDLIRKFIVLGWVVAFRFLLFAIPILLVFTSVAERQNMLLEWLTKTGTTIILGLCIGIIFFQRIGRHIRDTT